MNKDYKELVEFLDKKFNKVEEDISEFKQDMMEFKKDALDFQDKALKDLSDLKQEKSLGDAQDKRKTKVLEIHNDALKRGKILSDTEVLDINKLQAF